MNAGRCRGLRLGLALGASAVAAAGAAATESLDTLERAALRDNAELASMRASWKAMLQAPARDSALPNPMFTFGAMDRAGDFPGADERRYELSQGVPWPGKRGLRGAAAGAAAVEMRARVDAMALSVAMRVRENAYAWSAARRSLDLVRAENAVLARMAEVAQTRYTAGQVSQQDVLKAQAELSMLSARELDLEGEREGRAAQLNALLNRPAMAPLSLDVERPQPVTEEGLEATLARAQRQRPEIRAAQAAVERAGSERDLMRREYYPDLMLGLQYRQMPEDDRAMAMIGLDLPVWRAKNRAGVRRAQAMLESAQAAGEQARRSVEAEVREAWAGLDAARRKLRLYEADLLPQAELRFKASEAGYASGKADFMDLLESERFLLDARLMREMAEADVGMQWARLRQAAGDVTVEVRNETQTR